MVLCQSLIDSVKEFLNGDTWKCFGLPDVKVCMNHVILNDATGFRRENCCATIEKKCPVLMRCFSGRFCGDSGGCKWLDWILTTEFKLL